MQVVDVDFVGDGLEVEVIGGFVGLFIFDVVFGQLYCEFVVVMVMVVGFFFFREIGCWCLIEFVVLDDQCVFEQF